LGNRSRNGLTNPPGCVRREFETFAPIEFLNGPDQTKVAFLDQIEQIHSGHIGVAPGIGDDETKVGGQELAFSVASVADCTLQPRSFLGIGCCSGLERVAGLAAGFDPLRQLDFLIGRQKVERADTRQVLVDQVRCQPASVIQNIAAGTALVGRHLLPTTILHHYERMFV
jgi:hypothetical protein